ncbi:type I restriction enzyme, S subunit [Propionispira arboris]|uniref:Type I restriction enzyme, S subunit n=1 Tax=Propionispira arboris TaxID=84035 RepID=A0A1H7DDT3_9FIRM|nr:restriction endonuclease subunit S [Propionispira arboris]SEJ96395.1 type I restriction enzyme, S subunit [Propionispira arboris]
MAKQKQELSLDELLEQALVPEAEQPYKVPENWVWTRLGDITSVIGGGTPSSRVNEYYENGSIPWISPVDLSGYTNIYISHGKKNITELGLKKSSARIMPSGTVLLSSRAPIGYVAIAENVLSTNQGFKNFLPSVAYLPKYLYFYLKYSKVLLESYASGTTFLELSASKVSLVEIPLSPLVEQQRIVDRIESLFAKLDQAKKLVQNTLDFFANRKAAILHKAFSGELTANWRIEHGIGIDSWKEKKLGKLIGNGPQNGLYKPRSAYGSGCLIVRIDNFYDGHIHPWRTLKKLNIEEAEINLYSLKNNDILINRVNSINYLGKSALVRNIEEPAVFESNVMRITLNNDVNAEYIIKYLNSNMGLAELRKNAKHAVNQASINQTDVKNTLIQIPSPDEQKEIVRILDCILENEEKAKEMINVLGKINLIKKSILARAFRGELGTNDPSEENARTLLKKVLQEKK